MVRGKNTKGLVILLLLLMTNSLNASLTNNVKSNNYKLYIDSQISLKNGYRYEKPVFTGLDKSEFSDIYIKYNSKSVNFFCNSPFSVQARTLPPVPRTLIMVLCGLLCISFVKDRKLWLRVLSGIIWTSQTGLSFLPQIASRFVSINRIIRKNTDLYKINEPEKDEYLPKDTKYKRYIGLLRRLAGIPKHIEDNNTCAIKFGTCNSVHNLLNCFNRLSDNHEHNNSIKSFQLKAASLLSVLLYVKKYSVFKNTRENLISLIIIFACLARGPPILKLMQKLSFKWRVNAQNPSC